MFISNLVKIISQNLFPCKKPKYHIKNETLNPFARASPPKAKSLAGFPRLRLPRAEKDHSSNQPNFHNVHFCGYRSFHPLQGAHNSMFPLSDLPLNHLFRGKGLSFPLLPNRFSQQSPISFHGVFAYMFG